MTLLQAQVIPTGELRQDIVTYQNGTIVDLSSRFYDAIPPTGEASRMYSKYDEAQFHLRLTHELHAKIKQRAKMNNRSINAEIVATMEESLSKPSPVRGYRDEEERLASLISEQVKAVAADILRKDKTRD